MLLSASPGFGFATTNPVGLGGGVPYLPRVELVDALLVDVILVHFVPRLHYAINLFWMKPVQKARRGDE